MTYTGAMTMPTASLVLPQNAVVMPEQEMRCVEGGVPIPWPLIKAAAAAGATIFITSWDNNGKIWKGVKRAKKKYDLYYKTKGGKNWVLKQKGVVF